MIVIAMKCNILLASLQVKIYKDGIHFGFQ